ncbi:MAG TPA: sialidase family protein [Humisphaera sp.]
MTLVRPLALAALILSFAAPAPARAAEPARQDLWTAGEGGYKLYRIPGLIVTAKGTLLAYCEARKTGSDWGEIDLLVRRSTDGGKTWSDPKRLAERPADAKQNPVAAARKQAKEGQVALNNPVMIADRSGAVHLIYCVDYFRCFHARSDDDGQTFGPAAEITDQAFGPYRPAYDWKVLATGPGHGVQLSTGRLIVPVWMSLGTEGNGHRPSAVSTIYSDDAGKTWHGGAIVCTHPAPKNPSETAAVELADGRVMLNIRHEGPEKFRAVTTSADGAKDWTPVAYDKALPEPVCFGTILRVSGGKGSADKSRILFANPHNPTDRKRRNLVVKLSEDEGQTWAAQKVIDAGPAAYSDLAAGPGGKVYCLYESGGKSGKDYAALTLVTFGLDELK